MVMTRFLYLQIARMSIQHAIVSEYTSMALVGTEKTIGTTESSKLKKVLLPIQSKWKVCLLIEQHTHLSALSSSFLVLLHTE